MFPDYIFLSECNFFLDQTIGLIIYLSMLQQEQQQLQKTSGKEIIDEVKKMDEEISVNELLSQDDILDNEDDDMERWSDFSIEEELPMHSESKYS